MKNTNFKQQILFISDIEKIIGRDRLTLRRWWSGDKFPKPVKLNDSVLCWHSEAIEEWINEKMKVNVAANVQQDESESQT